MLSRAAAAVWLLALLGPSLPAERDSKPGFGLCGDCFYRQTPPRPLGTSAEPPLHRLCHRLPGGQAFATLSQPSCDAAVCSAFHLSHGWTGMEEEQRGEAVTEEGHGGSVSVPALLKGGSEDPSDSPRQQWDSMVVALVQSSIVPKCAALGGGVYILTGAGRLGAAEDGDAACQAEPLWSAACCSPPEGKAGFSVGLIKETEEAERQVSVKELEEMLGVEELFSDGCGGEGRETAAAAVGLHSDGPRAGKTDEDETEARSGTADPHGEESRRAPMPEERAGGDGAGASDLSGGTTAEWVTSVSGRTQQYAESVTEEEPNSTTTQTLVLVLSTTVSIIKAPLRPVFSTIIEFPAQVTHVLQEDLGVLAGLPRDALTLLRLLTSDLLSWAGSAGDVLLGAGESGFSGAYSCASSMTEALLSSCHAGVTGVGTLAGDTVGVFGGVLDNGWWVTRFFGGKLWEQTEAFVGAVVSEMGGQAHAVGGGLGRLAWRSGNGVGNAFMMGGSFITGMLDVVFGAALEALCQGSK